MAKVEYYDGIPDAQRQILAGLSDDERRAVKLAFREWVQLARAHEYAPVDGWKYFPAEVDHSALLNRILRGKRPLKDPPPKSHAYPNYAAVEGLDA